MIFPVQPDKMVLFSIARMSNTKDFGVLTDYFKANLERLRVENDTATDTALLWNQGRCQVLSDVLQLMEHAGEIMKNFE